MKDETIVGLFLARDESAIAEFGKQYNPLCLKLARDITGSRETAEECLNDLYLRLWNSIPPENPQSLKSYACRIIRNLALNRLEKQNAKKRAALIVELDECLPSPADEPWTEADRSELGAAIDGFLAAQPKQEALIFVRRYFYSDSVKEIAEKTGLRENRISKILMKSRKTLKKHLEKGGFTV